jgi:hypothetical protein
MPRNLVVEHQYFRGTCGLNLQTEEWLLTWRWRTANSSQTTYCSSIKLYNKTSQYIIIQIQAPYLWYLQVKQLSWDVPVKASFVYNKDAVLRDTIKGHCVFCITDTQTCSTKWKITPLNLNIIFLHTLYNTQLHATQQKKLQEAVLHFYLIYVLTTRIV